MNDPSMKKARIAIIATWLICLFNVLFPFPGIAHTIFLIIGAILIISHPIEWLIVRNKLKQQGHQGIIPFANVLVFGYAWWKPVLAEK
ncbi:MAG: DUF1145 domain-containing protein [Pseudomonadales bacterium]|nr:DUF1145 domain-containing protein [Pseudomonadales bacterium]